jgi:hypothetical protein
MHLNFGTGSNSNRKKIWDYGKTHEMIGLDLSDVNQDWNSFSEEQKQSFVMKHRFGTSILKPFATLWQKATWF